ncbi:MAG: efflux RND transporter periplasmic adaptor subunit [Alphaproteobacteria bacterium]
MPTILAASVVAAVAMAPQAWSQRPPSLVQVDPVREEILARTVPVLGRLVARQAGVVAARIGGPVDEMRVAVGDRVAKGDVLAVLEKARLEAAHDSAAAVVLQRRATVETANAELAQKQQELRRLEGIRSSAAFNQARLDDVTQEVAMEAGTLSEREAQLRQMLAQLERARIDLRDAEIRAPFAGVVSEKHTEVGAYLAVGSPVVTLLNDDDLEIEAAVPTDRLGGLANGAVVQVTLDDGTLHSAIVRAVVPQENPRTRTRPVRLTPAFDRPTKPLAANQSVTVAIPVGAARQVVTVHKDAIVRRGGGAIVFVVVDDAVQLRPVDLGDAAGGRFTVLSGLRPGEKVVTRGNESLRPGQSVRVGGAAKGPATRQGGGKGPPQTAERKQGRGK